MSLNIRVVRLLLMIQVVFLHAYNLHFEDIRQISLGHSLFSVYIQTYVSQGVTRIALPMFFLLSGFLFFSCAGAPGLGWFAQRYKRRFVTVFVPYVLWSLVAILFYFCLQVPSFTHGFFISKLIQDYTLAEFLYALFVDPLAYQLWFLRDLLIFIFISPLCYVLLSRLRWLLPLSLFALYILGFEPTVFAMEGLLYFVLGAYVRIKKLSLDRRWQGGYLTVAWLVLVLIETYLKVRYGGELALFHKVNIIVGIAAFWSVCFSLRHPAFLALSLHSFIIFAAHEPLLTLVENSSLYLLKGYSAAATFTFFVAPTITVCATVTLSLILRKSSPMLFGLFTGGRDTNAQSTA